MLMNKKIIKSPGTLRLRTCSVLVSGSGLPHPAREGRQRQMSVNMLEVGIARQFHT